MSTTMQISQYTSSEFVLSAGSVLFRTYPTSDTTATTIQICLLHYRKKNEWLLPKGRKDRGENMQSAAIRETFEETGYECELLPCTMPTRAPAVGVNARDFAVVGDALTEPFVVTIREVGDGIISDKGVKIIWWFLTRLKDPKAEKVLGTQTDSEDFESQFVDVDEALGKLTFERDREVVTQAWNLVKNDKRSIRALAHL